MQLCELEFTLQASRMDVMNATPFNLSRFWDRERRMVARQQEMYVRRSQRLAGESQRRAQETEEHR